MWVATAYAEILHCDDLLPDSNSGSPNRNRMFFQILHNILLHLHLIMRRVQWGRYNIV